MPLSEYFKGKGEKVMSDMKDRYGEKKGKSVFYATANKKGMAAKKKKRKKRPSAQFQAMALKGK